MSAVGRSGVEEMSVGAAIVRLMRPPPGVGAMEVIADLIARRGRSLYGYCARLARDAQLGDLILVWAAYDGQAQDVTDREDLEVSVSSALYHRISEALTSALLSLCEAIGTRPSRTWVTGRVYYISQRTGVIPMTDDHSTIPTHEGPPARVDVPVTSDTQDAMEHMAGMPDGLYQPSHSPAPYVPGLPDPHVTLTYMSTLEEGLCARGRRRG